MALPRGEPAEGATLRRQRRLPVALGLFALAFAVRCLDWPAIFAARRVYPAGNDAYYHLRRILYSVVNFPEFLSFDRYVNFPSGAKPIWTPVFDWTLAAVLRFTVGAADPEVLEWWLVWVAPLLGAATVAALYVLGLRFFDRTIALVAALVLTLLPSHYWYSRLGYLDHHALVALVSVFLLYATMDLLARSAAWRGTGPRLSGACVRLGVAMGAALLVWPGCLLHVGIAQTALLARWVGDTDPERARALARRIALANAIALIVVLPLSAGNDWERWGSFSPVVLSDFQPWLFASAALGILALGELGYRGAPCLGWVGRGGLAAALGAVVLLGTALLVPDLGRAAGQAWEWLARQETFQSEVLESLPLFRVPTGWDLMRGARYLTGFVFVFPALLAAFAWSVRRAPERAAFWALAWWAGVLYAAALNQFRFCNSFSVPMALTIGWCLVSCDRRVARRFAPPRRARVLRSVPLLAGLALVAPSLGFYSRHARNLYRVAQGGSIELLLGEQRQRVRERVARWLRGHSPATRGYLDSSQAPEYAVLGSWSDGHAIRYVARRPPITDNFGDDVGLENLALAEAYFSAQSEAEALDVVRRLGVRYVLATREGSGLGRAAGPDSQIFRLQRMNGSAGSVPRRAPAAPGGRVPDSPALEIPALGRHRLIYQSSREWTAEGPGEPYYRIFEVVPAVLLVGETSPGASVEAELELMLPRGESFTWRTSARADEGGRYALRLPYATDRSGGVGTGRRYTLRSGGESARIEVSEDAVQRGEEIAGPSLLGRASRVDPHDPGDEHRHVEDADHPFDRGE